MSVTEKHAESRNEGQKENDQNGTNYQMEAIQRNSISLLEEADELNHVEIIDFHNKIEGKNNYTDQGQKNRKKSNHEEDMDEEKQDQQKQDKSLENNAIVHKDSEIKSDQHIPDGATPTSMQKHKKKKKKAMFISKEDEQALEKRMKGFGEQSGKTGATTPSSRQRKSILLMGKRASGMQRRQSNTRLNSQPDSKEGDESRESQKVKGSDSAAGDGTMAAQLKEQRKAASLLDQQLVLNLQLGGLIRSRNDGRKQGKISDFEKEIIFEKNKTPNAADDIRMEPDHEDHQKVDMLESQENKDSEENPDDDENNEGEQADNEEEVQLKVGRKERKLKIMKIYNEDEAGLLNGIDSATIEEYEDLADALDAENAKTYRNMFIALHKTPIDYLNEHPLRATPYYKLKKFFHLISDLFLQKYFVIFYPQFLVLSDEFYLWGKSTFQYQKSRKDTTKEQT